MGDGCTPGGSCCTACASTPVQVGALQLGGVEIPQMPGTLPGNVTSLQRAMQPFLRTVTGRSLLVIIKGTRGNARAVINAVAALSRTNVDYGGGSTATTHTQLVKLRHEMEDLIRALDAAEWVLVNAERMRSGAVVPASAGSPLPAWFKSHPDWTIDTVDVLPPGLDWVTRNVEWSSMPPRYRPGAQRFLTPAYIAPMSAMNRIRVLREHIATQVHAFARFVFAGIIDALKVAARYVADVADAVLPSVGNLVFWPVVAFIAYAAVTSEQRA